MPPKKEILTKTRGKGVRWCCPHSDCPKCFRSELARNGHMTSHVRTYPRKPIEHGTARGYIMEIRRGEMTCGACRAAWNRYYRDLKAVVPEQDTGQIFVEGEWVDASDI